MGLSIRLRLAGLIVGIQAIDALCDGTISLASGQPWWGAVSLLGGACLLLVAWDVWNAGRLVSGDGEGAQ